jgi:hypothetical protein
MGELDVAANGSHLLGLFEKPTYAGPHFCEQSRHGFLNVERLLAERVHQILVAVAVLDQFGKQLEESRFRVIPRDQAAGFLDQIRHSSYDNGLEQSLFGRKMPVERSGTHARALGNFVDRRSQAGGCEDFPCGLYDQFLVALGISAHSRHLGSWQTER